MADSERPNIGLDAAASIKAFLEKIPQAGKSRVPSAQHSGEVTDKVGELNLAEDKATDTKANSTVPSAIPSTVASNIASPESKASDALPPEKMTEWVHENAPPDHFKSKNPLLGTVQSQATPHGSPQATGVLAPPPTPETISSLAIGKMISDELDKIPEERFMSLGDSRYAPKNHSRLSTTARSSSTSFFSPVPRATKPRDDPSFTRMSFKAADTPTIPAFVNPTPKTISAAEKSFLTQDPPSAAGLKENVRIGGSKDGWSQTTATNGTKVFTPDTPDALPAAPQLKPADLDEAKAFQSSLSPLKLLKSRHPKSSCQILQMTSLMPNKTSNRRKHFDLNPIPSPETTSHMH